MAIPRFQNVQFTNCFKFEYITYTHRYTHTLYMFVNELFNESRAITVVCLCRVFCLFVTMATVMTVECSTNENDVDPGLNWLVI